MFGIFFTSSFLKCFPSAIFLSHFRGRLYPPRERQEEPSHLRPVYHFKVCTSVKQSISWSNIKHCFVFSPLFLSAQSDSINVIQRNGDVCKFQLMWAFLYFIDSRYQTCQKLLDCPGLSQLIKGQQTLLSSVSSKTFVKCTKEGKAGTSANTSSWDVRAFVGQLWLSFLPIYFKVHSIFKWIHECFECVWISKVS